MILVENIMLVKINKKHINRKNYIHKKISK